MPDRSTLTLIIVSIPTKYIIKPNQKPCFLIMTKILWLEEQSASSWLKFCKKTNASKSENA
jgi:hypothetical protein